MNDLTSFVEGLVSQLGRAFFLAGFLPAVIFVAVNQYVLFSPSYGGTSGVWNFFPEVSSPWLGLFSGEMLTTVVLGLGLGLLLVVLNSSIIRLFEGFGLTGRVLLFPLYLRNLRRHRSRYAAIAIKQAERRELLAEAEESQHYDEDAAFAIFQELHRLHGEKEKTEPVQMLPYDRGRLLPTAFGNAWAIMEEYPLIRYGLDGMLFWPYIREIVSTSNPRLLEDIDNQKLIIDVVVHLSLLSGIAAAEGVILGMVRGNGVLIAGGVLAAALCAAFYQASVGYVRSLGSLITKSYDLYRLPVLDALGLERPHDLDQEYWTWTRLGAFLRRGEPFYFDMLDRRGESGEQD